MNEIRRHAWKRPVIWAAVACALGAGLTGCGSSAAAGSAQAATSSGSATSLASPQASSSSGARMPATATTIMIENFAYTVPASVAPGSTVRVMNMDGEAHSVTSDKDGAFSVVVPAGTTVTFTAPATAGSYAFHCEYHSNMHGTLVVE